MKKFSGIALLLLGLVLINLSADRWVSTGSNHPGSRWQHSLSDWYWLKGYDAWLQKDETRLVDDYSFATALNPANLIYWRLAAQTIAYDFPVWRQKAAGSQGEPGSEEESRIRYGEQALAFFERSRTYFQDNPDWYMAGGFLAESAASNRSRAIGYYEEALQQKDPPYLAGRMYARLLIEDGRAERALAFLKSWYATLPDKQIEARKSDIREWIVSLENQLDAPRSQLK